jgi:hypothetical protein
MKVRNFLWVVGLALASSAWLMQSQAQSADTSQGSFGGGPDIGAPGIQASPMEASPLVATLDMAKPEPQLRLTVENRGTSTVRILQ